MAAPWGWWLPLGGLAAAAAFLLLRGLLLTLLLTVVLAYLVAPPAACLQRRAHLPRAAAVLLTYAALLAAAFAALAFALPVLVAELQRLAAGLPRATAALEAWVAALRTGYGRLPLPAPLRTAADQALLRVEAVARATLNQALGVLLGVFQLALPLLLAPVLAYYLLSDLPRLRAGFARLWPPGERQAVLHCLRDLDAVIAGWLRGELLTAAAVGGLAALAVWLLQLRYALLLGFAAGGGELLPYFGPVLGAVPALAVAAASGGWPRVLWTAVAFFGIQQLESVVLAPLIVGGSVGLPPLAVLLALVAGERLGGLAGVVLAVPAAGCARVLLAHLWRALTAARTPRRLT